MNVFDITLIILSPAIVFSIPSKVCKLSLITTRQFNAFVRELHPVEHNVGAEHVAPGLRAVLARPCRTACARQAGRLAAQAQDVQQVPRADRPCQQRQDHRLDGAGAQRVCALRPRPPHREQRLGRLSDAPQVARTDLDREVRFAARAERDLSGARESQGQVYKHAV